MLFYGHVLGQNGTLSKCGIALPEILMISGVI